MHKLLRALGASAAITFTLSACTIAESRDVGASPRVGDVTRHVRAVVVGAEPIRLKANAVGGAGYGALTGGGLTLASGSDNAAVVVTGALIGAVVGQAVQDEASTFAATKYTLRTENGASLVAAQPVAGNEVYAVSDHVIVEYGAPIRLRRDLTAGRSEGRTTGEQ